MANKEVIKILAENNLKVTPQRTAVLEVILGLENHPTADDIVDYLRLNFPHVPIGTVYKILDAFVEKGIVKKVKTDNGIIRYDAILEPHHHLYCSDSERIEDYYDDELNKIIDNYFKKKKIPNFSVNEIRLQIVGKYIENTKSK
jgi:Fur family peroxide stress response transcriptional regulator